MSVLRYKRMGPALAMATLAVGAASVTLTIGAQGATDPATRGKLLFLQCAACHSVVPGAAAKVGPNLAGVVGRKAGTGVGSPVGFKYSAALAKSGLTWNEATLDKWLTAPSALVPGTIMLFRGLPNPQDRMAVIAYLKTTRP